MKEYSFSPFPNLTTKRLNLRQLNHDDQEDIFALRSNEEVSQFIDRPIAKEVDEALQYIKMINEGIDRNDWVLWAISLKETKHLIGTICLWNFSKELSKGEVGYELSPKFQGKGIMQEALTAVLEFGFETLKLHSIEGIVQSDNQRSIKLLEKNNFINKGRVEKETSDEEISNSIIFELENNFSSL
jgi:[ribosomal protein S5]-alanine N-acetyltransferase